MNGAAVYKPRHIPPASSWWTTRPVVGGEGFTEYVVRQQWPRMRESKSAIYLTGSESGATVSQWRPRLGGSGTGFEE